MDYETKSPSKAMGVSLMPVYGVVASLATLALLIISKDLLIYRLICDHLVMTIKRKWVGDKFLFLFFLHCDGVFVFNIPPTAKI